MPREEALGNGTGLRAQPESMLSQCPEDASVSEVTRQAGQSGAAGNTRSEKMPSKPQSRILQVIKMELFVDSAH